MHLGAWSAILLVLAVEIVALALILLLASGNRLANRMLGWMLLVMAGLLTPFILGYAGAYDAWPWLSFAPFAVPLALGPLAYAHLLALVHKRAPGWRHWLAPALQFAWQAVVFPFPLSTKNQIDTLLVEPFIGPASDALAIASLAFYGLASWRLAVEYEAWLRLRRRQTGPARRLRIALTALAVLVAMRGAYSLFDLLVRPVDYFDLFAYYLLLGAIGVVLGVDGWRNAADPPPVITAPDDTPDPAIQWLETIRRRELWRDPDLTAELLARALGTNRLYLSRALAPHGGFAGVIGAARADAVARWIADGREGDLLELALAAGFGSKASFNRAFRARFGVTPAQWRRERGATAQEGAMLPE